MAIGNALLHFRTVKHMKKILKADEEGNEESSQQLVVCMIYLVIRCLKFKHSVLFYFEIVKY